MSNESSTNVRPASSQGARDNATKRLKTSSSVNQQLYQEIQVQCEGSDWGTYPAITIAAAFIMACDKLQLPKGVYGNLTDLQSKNDLVQLIREALVQNDLSPVLSEPRLFKQGTISPPVEIIRETSTSFAESKEATLTSWAVEYKGEAPALLRTFISSVAEKPNVYARYAAIIQSSGMGKSRLMDELSKTVFTIPINLRAGSDGYPPSDKQVRRYFLGDWDTPEPNVSPDEIYIRSCAFLASLFDVTQQWMKETAASEPQPEVATGSNECFAAKFRALMTEGTTFGKHCAFRTKFYDDTVAGAEKLLLASRSVSPRGNSPAADIVFESDSHLVSSPPTTTHTDSSAKPQTVTSTHVLRCEIMLETLKRVDCRSSDATGVVLVFDEAHDLTKTSDSNASKFSELRRALRKLHLYDVFTFFLSTTGHLYQFITSRYLDASSRIHTGELAVIGPFSELDFDVFARTVRDGEYCIADLVKVSHMVTYGRPLFASRYMSGNGNIKQDILGFARQKLLGLANSVPGRDPSFVNQLACLAARLPLRFEALSNEGRDLERQLVERHMRVCLGVIPDNHTIITSASSEPLLAEAAMDAMKDFESCKTLDHYVQSSAMSTGDRGELIVEQIMLGAHDKARKQVMWGAHEEDRAVDLAKFFVALFGQDTADRVASAVPSRVMSKEDFHTLKERFPRAKIWFNHYVKVHSSRVLNLKYLWRYIPRGAAVVCTDNQTAVDAAWPFIIDSSLPVGSNNTGVILGQTKNDLAYSDSPDLPLFEAIDPFKLGIFDEDETNLPPLIRIVFALAASTPCIKLVELRTTPPREAKIKAGLKIREVLEATPHASSSASESGSDMDARHDYTAYDIWCGGAKSSTFGCIQPAQDDIYDNLLRLSLRRFPVYLQSGWAHSEDEKKRVEDQRRKLNPGDSKHSSHWSNWINEGS